MPAIALPLIDRLRQMQVIRYALASLGALAVDMGGFLLLLRMGLMPALASGCGYTLGIVAHWLLSSRAVFTQTVARGGTARLRQQSLFLMSALIGLGVTTAVVGLLTLGGIDARLAKAVAIVASFVVTWILRKKVVFR